MNKRFNAGKILLGILIAAAAFTALGFVIMYLWNSILPATIHVGTITFWQALGIFVLAKILFGFGGKGPGGGRPFWWKREMRKKMRNMTAEEREKFKEEMYRRMDCWHSPSDNFRHSFYKNQENVNKTEPDESNK